MISGIYRAVNTGLRARGVVVIIATRMQVDPETECVEDIIVCVCTYYEIIATAFFIIIDYSSLLTWNASY